MAISRKPLLAQKRIPSSWHELFDVGKKNIILVPS